MSLSKKRSLLAVLARFNGNRKQAHEYCTYLATWYPDLTPEYGELAAMLEEKL